MENSIIQFITVPPGSPAVSVMPVLLPNGKRPRKIKDGESQDRAWVEINLENLRHNVSVLHEALPAGCRLMAVVKGNAYGHGAAPISTYLNSIGINSFAVATMDEGINLRKSGVKGEILILGYTPAKRASTLYHYHLSQTVADAEHAAELNRFGKPILIHIKVDTGMNRLGENYRHLAEISSIFRCKNLRISGIFTHLSVSDRLEEADTEFTNQQIQNFYALLDKLSARQIDLPRIHIQSSYGVINYPELRCDYARVGIALYGSLSTPDTETKCSLDLRPVLALKSKVVLVRTIEAGESVSYGRTFIAQKEMRIAVVSIGYADGYPRSLSTGKGYALIQGYRVSIIGRICMDQLIVDVTNIPNIKRGDIVTLIGKDGSEEITVEQVADNAGTISNELLSRLNECRLNRILINC
jgi:serine/alanine racemase